MLHIQETTEQITNLEGIKNFQRKIQMSKKQKHNLKHIFDIIRKKQQLQRRFTPSEISEEKKLITSFRERSDTRFNPGFTPVPGIQLTKFQHSCHG